jgi:flagellar biosynthesis/type III secretory pathway ATPase
LGSAGHYPAIQVLDSVSRLQSKLATPGESESARRIREALAIYRQSEDLINLGAYVSGSNARLDSAIRSHEEILKFLRQTPVDRSSSEETARRLEELAAMV